MSKYLQLLTYLVLTNLGWGGPHYVVPPGTGGNTPMPNFTNWATAATNIQDAVNVSSSGDLIYITNGYYRLTNEIVISNKNLMIRSFNDGRRDCTNTIIDANYPSQTNRCIMLYYSSSLIEGFTLTNGVVPTNYPVGGALGGGIFMYNSASTANDCIISCNKATRGGGVYVFEYNGLITNCVISGNVATSYGGGIFLRNNGIVKNSIVAMNLAPYSGGAGGGIWSIGNSAGGGMCLDTLIINNYAEAYGGLYMSGLNCITRNCQILGNNSSLSYTGGGGVYISSGGTNLLLERCVIISNSAPYGAVLLALSGGGTQIVEDCLIINNPNGGIMFNNGNCMLKNCSIAGNTRFGITNRLSATSVVVNTIVYFNTTNFTGDPTMTWTNSCTIPLPISSVSTITNDPLFVDMGNDNYRLQNSSSCINAGLNQSWMTGAVDLDGRSRIDRFSGIVDMGCYEYLPAGAIYSVP